jgi:hypothetical protein
MTISEDMVERLDVIDQHIGWLKQYVALTTANSWRDMMDPAALRSPRSIRAFMRLSGSFGTQSTRFPTITMPRLFGRRLPLRKRSLAFS